MKAPLDHGLDLKAGLWSDKKRWSRSGSNRSMVWLVSCVKTFIRISDQIQVVKARFHHNQQTEYEKVGHGTNTLGEEEIKKTF